MVAMHHRGETHEHRRDLADSEHLGLAQITQVVGRGERAMSTGTPGMHDAFGNAFAVEALQLLDQLHVLQQYRAGCAGSL